MADHQLSQLEQKVETLIKHIGALREENHSLRESQTSLMAERARLIEKNENARSRVEAIITRLKAMEIEI